MKQAEPAAEERNLENNPLYKIIGIAGPGGPPDAAENHDKYLYGQEAQRSVVGV